MRDFDVQVEQLVARLHLLPQRRQEQQEEGGGRGEEGGGRDAEKAAEVVEAETEPSQVSRAQ